MYDPVIGRFISADSVDQNWYDPQLLNRYAYTRNNPLKYTDPTGHFILGSSHDESIQNPNFISVKWSARAPAGSTFQKVSEMATKASAAYFTGGVVKSAVVKAGVGLLKTSKKIKGLFTKKQTDVAPKKLPTPSKGPDFVVTPKGESIRVPTGASGPTATRAPGVQYTGGAGGKGLENRVTGVRVMEGNANQGPRAVYMNRTGQTVDPATGRTVSNADTRAHHYLKP